MMFKIFNGMTEVYIKPRKTLKLTTTKKIQNRLRNNIQKGNINLLKC